MDGLGWVGHLCDYPVRHGEGGHCKDVGGQEERPGDQAQLVHLGGQAHDNLSQPLSLRLLSLYSPRSSFLITPQLASHFPSQNDVLL